MQPLSKMTIRNQVIGIIGNTCRRPNQTVSPATLDIQTCTKKVASGDRSSMHRCIKECYLVTLKHMQNKDSHTVGYHS